MTDATPAPESSEPAPEPVRAWKMLPIVVLRQAGFPFDLLDRLADPLAEKAAAELAAAETTARTRAVAVKATLRTVRHSGTGPAASAIGALRPLPGRILRGLTEAANGHPGQDAIGDYQEGALRLAEAWEEWDQTCRDSMLEARTTLRTLFRDSPLLRDALLLSNAAAYQEFAGWLEDGRVAGGHGRRSTDTLARYLQRLAAKNETHSHFGPLNVGVVDREVSGITWSPGTLSRRAHLTHWAAEKLARVVSDEPAFADHVRPRRRPWAFGRDGVVTLYTFTTEDGFSEGWRFARSEPVRLTPGQWSVFEHCDGDRTLARLRAELGDGVDEALAELVARDLVVARVEVPVGTYTPLTWLRAVGPPDSRLAAVDEALAALPLAPPEGRPAAIAALDERFTAVTGVAAHRGAGLHYADRDVFYEEAHGRLRDLRIGGNVAELIETELVPVYELAAAGPRLRLLRETEVLAGWAAERFGATAEIPLDGFYEEYFADREGLLARVDIVDAELSALDADLAAMLLDGADEDTEEVVVPAERMESFLRRCPAGPPTLLNPDVMLAAESAEALARGDFRAVVGDCHATRELLSHSSMAPLITEAVPDLAAVVTAAYRTLVEPGELLCDLARSHPDKTATRVQLDLPDLEIFGRSGQPRTGVIQPSELYLRVDAGRIALHSRRFTERLRLMAPPSGGPSIRLDPLAPFAFPRRLGGLGLEIAGRSRLPRIRTGRVVLQRRLWRIGVTELAGVGPDRSERDGDAAEFYAAGLVRARHGLPRQVFVKFAGEPKPIYVDFASPILVRQMFRLARRSQGVAAFSEMLPGPEHLWLYENGGRMTCELRCTVLSRG